jgi:NTP pyrophosphatase (non-canonical NTP hydrolase)
MNLTIKPKQKELYKQAIAQWGEMAQIDICIEECAELIHALSKLKRGSRTGLPNCIEEIADVYIMLGQLRLIIGKDKEIEDMIKVKLARLKTRVANGKNGK